jgi:hypothetical protein
MPHVDGVGHRTVRARGLDFHLADDVLAVLDELGIERVKLVAERARELFAA